MKGKAQNRGKKEYIYGLKPVLEVLSAKKRRFFKIYISRSERSQELKEIEHMAKMLNIPIIDVERKKLKSFCGTGEHQGVVAQVTPYPVLSEKTLMKDVAGIRRMLILDRIQDPRNMGAIFRSAYAFGFHHAVIPEKNSAPPSPLALKASAGLMEKMRVYRVGSLFKVISLIQKMGFMLVTLHAKGGKNPEDLKLSDRTALIVGNEMEGVRRGILKASDDIVTIPMCESVDSLNVSVACGIMMYVIDRKRGEKGAGIHS